MLLAFAPAEMFANVTDPIETVESARVNVLLNRLEEIKAMDKSDLSSSERKALRKEVRATKKEMKQVGGGVYLSIGAILLIVLVLILLL
ncbi:MAG: hypothetical protein CO119_10445 [Flavobacteriales bacterium CG_4_9_14_3_um_filter_40_17]|nr:MAG: hypothetical protein CO119_10445 [Flavobacteriales bacterium CG_4_9_14_3_um_filter_40_17]